MKFIVIVLSCVGLSVAYGIIHDNITARLCIEYFTVGHRIIIQTTDPTLIAMIWGVIATWWVGMAMGLFVASAARIGNLPKLELRDLFRPLLILLASMGYSAALSGMTAYSVVSRITVPLPKHLADKIPVDNRPWFLVDLWIHNASYLSGICGSIILCIYILRVRWLRFLAETKPQ